MGSQESVRTFPFLSGGLADKDNGHTFPFRQLDFSKTIGDVSDNTLEVKTEKKGWMLEHFSGLLTIQKSYPKNTH